MSCLIRWCTCRSYWYVMSDPVVHMSELLVYHVRSGGAHAIVIGMSSDAHAGVTGMCCLIR